MTARAKLERTAMGKGSAFTLIELLVVITIIVVLLALLTPALDRAIYQAELTVCGANLHATGSTITSYAMQHKRRYPSRTGHGGAIEPDKLVNFGSTNPDDREVLEGYIAINKQFNDPLCEPVDLEKPYEELQNHVYASYTLWYGWQFTGPGTSSPGLLKLGDRLGWVRDIDGDGQTESYSFPYMATDADFLATNGAADIAMAYGSHPDSDGVLQQVAREQGEVPAYPGAAVQWTWSRYESFTSYFRGTIDMNLGRTDGAVIRQTNLEREENLDAPARRMVRIPRRSNGDNWPDQYYHLPK